MSGSAECRNQPPRGKRAQRQLLIGLTTRSPERVRIARAFFLTMTYMDVRFCRVQKPTAERQTCAATAPDRTNNALSRARTDRSCFFLDYDLHGCPVLQSAETNRREANVRSDSS